MNYKLLSPYRLDRSKVKRLLFDLDKRNIDIAQEKGIPPAIISQHIQGKSRNPKVQQAIADFLGVPLDRIVLKPKNGTKRAA